MSATGRSKVRDPDDHYRTPSWCVDAVLPHLPTSGVIVDAGCGDGAILERVYGAVGDRDTRLIGVEPDVGRWGSALKRFSGIAVILRQDFLDFEPSHIEADVGLVISNPPFRLAKDFVTHALELATPARGTVAMLLRLNWLASIERVAFHKAHPADVYVLPRRPAFAASIKCKKPREMCGWHVVQPLTAERPTRCPSCGGDLRVCTTDACEYGWFCWGPGRGGRWSILDVPQTHDIDLAS